MSWYDLTTLPNGLRVVTERMPGIRSAAIGCWVDTGTRDELGNEAGASHFLEHLLFKGSEEVSAREISETFDAIGAHSNAFTTKEQTCFWTRLLDDELGTGLRLLAEMLQRPAFREHEIDSERQVVIEEILMSEDDPDDTVFEAFSETLFTGHPLERPILGTRESITGMSSGDISGYWKRRYTAGSTVIAIVSSLPHQQVLDEVEKYFGDWGGDGLTHDLHPLQLVTGARVVHRETEQAHVVMGGELFPRGDERRWAFEIANHVLGGGMSSRLFQTIREERGLVYSVYSFGMPFADIGAWGIYAGTAPEQLPQVMELIEGELTSILRDGITEGELERAKGSVRGSIALSMEDANSRMSRLGRQVVTNGELLSTGERIARIEAVTREDVASVLSEVIPGPRVLTGLGPFAERDLEAYVA
ncbi:MAG: insulinase family protein [Acidimicrobiia bacterium]|jgi:predicted Zn-dependent peptidase|nr:MAG: insulinase family protein [Acidimicrobiia bacterium]